MSTFTQRIVANAAAVIEWQSVDQDGEPADPSGTVTVGVVRSDGSQVVAAGTATTTPASDSTKRTRALTIADTALLDVLTATWTAAGQTIGVTTHEVVGGVYASVTEIRGIEDSLADTTDDVTADIKRCRAEVESMIEQVCQQAFVPRFSVIAVAADRQIRWANLRAVRWTRVVPNDGTIAIPGGTANLAGPWSSSPWDSPWGAGGTSVILAGIEHGLNAPPADLKRAAVRAIRQQVNASKSAVSARAMSYQSPSGEIQRFPTPGLGPWVTGIPDVDETIQRYVMPDIPGVIRITPSAGFFASSMPLVY